MQSSGPTDYFFAYFISCVCLNTSTQHLHVKMLVAVVAGTLGPVHSMHIPGTSWTQKELPVGAAAIIWFIVLLCRFLLPVPVVDAISGAVGEVSQIVLLYPLETIKVRVPLPEGTGASGL